MIADQAAMSEELAFLNAIVEGGEDPIPRLVFADWLEERGDARAHYFRVEAELVVREWDWDPWEPAPTRCDQLFAALANSYLAGDENDRRHLRDELHPDHFWSFILQIRRSGLMLAGGIDDARWLRRGLAIGAIVNARLDYRDSIVSLAILRHAAECAGVATRPLFNEAFEYADAAFHGVLRNARDANCKGYAADFVPPKVRLERNW